MTTMDDIREYAQRLAEAFHPERIILFGSWARGEQTVDSDVDLMVVMPFEGSQFARMREIERAVKPPFRMDLYPISPEDYAEKLRQRWFFFELVDSEGVVLHEGRHARMAG